MTRAQARNGHRHQGKKLFLIDGNSFCYRAYYAIRSLSNSKGEPTNAIYGFVTMLRKLIHDEKPESLAICFDRKEPTFRHERYKEYKAQRKPMPDDLVQQLEPIKEFCRAQRLAMYECAGYEADDLLGTIAHRAEKEGFEVYIVTGDKDAMQLVNDQIKILNPHKDNAIFGREDVRRRFDGLGPEKVVDVMALMGDSSDNIPGVPGIGEKTAIKLIREFGSVENLLKNVSKIHSKSQQTLLKENTQAAELSKDLARIDTRVPIEIDWEELRVKDPDGARLVEFFKRYEFRTLLKEYTPAGAAVEEERNYRLIATEKEFEEFFAELKSVRAFSFDTETTSADPMRAHPVGLSFSWRPFGGYYIAVSSEYHQAKGLPLEKVVLRLKPILEDSKVQKYGQHLKYDWIVMKRLGVTIQGYAFDTMIASYLVNPIKLNHNLDDIALEYLEIKKISTESLLGSGKKQVTMDGIPLEKVSDYACEDADCVFRLVPLLKSKLAALDLVKLFLEVEMPLAEVLAKMEMNGVNLDLQFLRELSENASGELDRLTCEIYDAAGEEFNINSTRQLADILFVKLKLPVIKRTKTGFSTDVTVLEKLALDHELPRKLLEYREKAKLKSTYLDALPTMIHPETGLIHTSYHQTTTVTGRLSSSDPNLQNIPIKAEAGRLIRKAFIPRPASIGHPDPPTIFGGEGSNARSFSAGNRTDSSLGGAEFTLEPVTPLRMTRKILSADYSQIELRILAHLSGDENLTRAFQEDRDIHRFTATLLYGVSEADVTREMRNIAKTVNFSIIYGKSAFGLSHDLGLSIPEADAFIQNYFARYRAVKDYLESQKEKAREDGYLTTLLGRRSYFPDIHSKNAQIRQFAERAAVNAPIQGSAADLIKLAMIKIQRRLEAESLRSLMIMQVHDELVFDIPIDETEKAAALVKEEMEGAYRLHVPLRADTFVGDSWYKE